VTWLSTTVKPPNERRLYAISPEARGMICCCTDTLSPQSDGRTPEPEVRAGSNEFVSVPVPNLRFEIWPQKSPPPGRRSWVLGFCRSQSGRKLPFASVHVRCTPSGPNGGFVFGRRSTGFVL